MVASEGTFFRQYKGKGYAARVHIVVNETDSPSTVAVDSGIASESTSFSQGITQKAYAPAYNDWIQGAIIGATYTLAQFKNSTYVVTITDIVGMETDTNPTIVAVATIFAVWKAVNYYPTKNEIQPIEDKALASWDLPFDTLPAFRASPL